MFDEIQPHIRSIIDEAYTLFRIFPEPTRIFVKGTLKVVINVTDRDETVIRVFSGSQVVCGVQYRGDKLLSTFVNFIRMKPAPIIKKRRPIDIDELSDVE